MQVSTQNDGTTSGLGEAVNGAGGPAIVVRGRHTEVTDRFRRHVTAKVAGLDRFDHKLFRLDVEISEEHNPRRSSRCERIEITGYSRGPVIRAEAEAADAYAALDIAVAKLEERLRRAADRRHSRGSRVARAHAVEAHLRPVDAVDATPEVPGQPPTPLGTAAPGDGQDPVVVADGPFVVREKIHAEEPISLDEALSRMELVGHEFYLFEDSSSGCPSVVYRRRAYDYGVLRLRNAGES